MLEKIVSRLLFPVPVICELLIAGLVLLWFTRRQKAGKILVTIGTAMLLLLGIGQVSGVFLRTLEHRYPPLKLSSLPARLTKSENGTFIVVLGSGFSTDPRVDLNSHLSQDALARLLAGVQICRQVESCRLVLSGGPSAATQAMRDVAISLGILQQEIILEEKSRNTEQEARFIKPMVGNVPFILVTSASHMPRAMGLFRKLGMQPIAAPTDYIVQRGGPLVPDGIYPSSSGLFEAERFVYECLGMAWEKLRGQI
jgi:uncharacterized SAM-binding protein YcdF (DUF218 family)